MEGKEMIYKYLTLYREPGPGAVPKRGLIECGYERETTPTGRTAWGWAKYNRELTADEIKDYELEFVGGEAK
jgi:hypothetical protein